jgi:hypothetical protein
MFNVGVVCHVLIVTLFLDAKTQPLLDMGPEIGDPDPDITAMKQTTILSAQPHLEGCVARMEVRIVLLAILLYDIILYAPRRQYQL